MLKVGLTGGIGSGKSTVAGIFQLFGIPVYVADQQAHDLMVRDTEIRDQIIALLGKDSYAVDGKPDRKYIAARVFGDRKRLEDLNAIIHPAVRRDFTEWCIAYTSLPYVLHEAAILFESGVAQLMDENILVWASESLRIERVMQRDGISREDVLARLQHQWSDERKISFAQFVVINDGAHSLIRQVQETDAALRYIAEMAPS